MFGRVASTRWAVAALGVFLAASASATPVVKTTQGRPQVRLDRLELPQNLADGGRIEARLRKTLRREAARADWGAGRENQIQYRFSVTTLEVTRQGDVLRVRCSALGQLPGGQKARSDLSFGGKPSESTALVSRVLDVVARGVVTRLAQLERRRRGLN